MARRKDHTREELQNLAINAGHQLITQIGFRNFSARAVAKKIGYTIGTIYNIFESHEDFILHINAKTLDIWYSELLKLQKSKNKITIYDVANFYIDFAKEHYNIWSALYEFSTGEETKIPKWYIEKMQKFFEYTENLILPYCKNKKEAKNSAHILWSGIHGICTLFLSNKLSIIGTSSPKKMSEKLITNFLSKQQDD
jgi:AcrR family transcriptional regulator